MDGLGVGSPADQHNHIDNGHSSQDERGGSAVVEADEDNDEGQVVDGVVDGVLPVHEHGEDAQLREYSVEQNQR